MKTIVGKLVILGDQGVGKTSLIIKYIENTFSTTISPTIGASFFTCKICIEDIIIKLQVWDTAGQERFKAMAPMFYRNANAALLMFDITREKSFESMKYWAQELRGNVQEPMVLCVVGNKLDLSEHRMVSRDQAKQYADSIGATYFESSCKNDQGIEQIFGNIASGVVRLTDNGSVSTLKVFEGNIDASMAKASDLQATDIGREELHSGRSTNAIAHANDVTPTCC